MIFPLQKRLDSQCKEKERTISQDLKNAARGKQNKEEEGEEEEGNRRKLNVVNIGGKL